MSFEDDILQELTLRLFVAKKHEKDINVYFAYKVLRNILNDLHNKIARDRNKKNNFQRSKFAEGNTSKEKGPLALTIDKEQFEKINHLMDRLDRNDRMVLTLRHFDGYSFKEIANVLRYKNEGGARMRYNRIIKQLGVKLDEKKNTDTDDQLDT